MQELDAELAHEILHVIIRGKTHHFALFVELLFDLVLYIHGIAIPCETPHWSYQCARKVTLPSNAAGDLVAAYLMFDGRAFEIRNGVDEPVGELNITVWSV